MRNMTKTISLLLCLLLVLQLVGTAGDVFAEGAPGGDSSVVWSVSAKDAEGNDQTFTDAEALADALGPGFALDWGKDEHDAPITAPTVADLRRNGVKITPPAGCAVSSLMIVADGASPDEGSQSLLKLAKATVDGSGAVALPAAIFAEVFDASPVGTVFNGSGERYVLSVALDPIAPAEQITLSYTAGELSSAFGDTALFDGGNSVSFEIESGKMAASGSFAELDADLAETAMDSYGRQFTAWKLILPGGASMLVQGGDRFTLSSSATLEAQWKEYSAKRSVTFRVTDVSGEYKGSPYVPSAFTISSGSLAEGHSAVPAYTGEQTLPGSSEASAVFTIIDASGADVTDRYRITVEKGTITVSARSEKKPLTVRISDAEKDYDGSADVSATYALAEGELLGSDTLTALSLSANTANAGTGIINGRFCVLNGDFDTGYYNYPMRESSMEAWETKGAEIQLEEWYALDDVANESRTLGQLYGGSVEKNAELAAALEARVTRIIRTPAPFAALRMHFDTSLA